MRQAATYQEAIARVEDLTQRICELDTLMEQKINQMLDEEVDLIGTWTILNRREALVREQHKLMDQWDDAINDLLRFLPSYVPERHGRPSMAGF
ncbi:hypothetical protein KSZ_72720 [Dictyobacter formicarum]|uniref:Uncharacterized protein n=2 Tax=Dictyobacter formicarum TaxID=2778368 RepID=A0ABQ3VW51_9CHLR|nr:hypothetical protein KSZ_72720 [Dictyobacter formicarum]